MGLMTQPNDTFRGLYDAHAVFVARALQSLGVRAVDVGDVTQRVFLVAHFKLNSFEGRSTVAAWLYAICRRVASGYRRASRRRREQTIDPRDLDLCVGALASSPETRDDVRRASLILGKLRPCDARIFVLFEVEGLLGAEIAGLLGLTEGTVRARLRSARKQVARDARRLQLSTQG
jgi:RNA polymerase sigma-70 factor (ECF subfamily)